MSTLNYLLSLHKSENAAGFSVVKKVCNAAKDSSDHRNMMTVCDGASPPPSLSPSCPVPHLDKLSLYLSSPPPVSSPPPSHHYFPLPGLSSPHSSPQSLDLLHAASIPVTALSHIIQPRNMYAVAGSSLQGGTSTAEVGVKSSLASLPDPQPQVSTDFLLCCLPFPHMTSVKCSDDTSTLPFFYVECCMQGIL